MTSRTDDVWIGGSGIAALAEVVCITDQAVRIGTGIATAVEERQGTDGAIDCSVRRTRGTEIGSITLVADSVSGHTADNAGSICLQDISSCADPAIVGIITGETVGKSAVEACSLSATHVVEQVVGGTGTTEIGHITAGTVVDVTGHTLTDGTRQQSGLIADLAETVGGAGGTISQIADIAGASYVGVDCVIGTILAVVEAITEGTVGDVTELADSTAEGISSQAS